jgi:hypothetical protein
VALLDREMSEGGKEGVFEETIGVEEEPWWRRLLRRLPCDRAP